MLLKNLKIYFMNNNKIQIILSTKIKLEIEI